MFVGWARTSWSPKMSLGRFRGYLKNPFLGTHTPRLVKETLKSVDLHLHKGPTRFARAKKSLFDEAFGHHNLAVGRKFQELSWGKREKDPENPQHYWLITRLVPVMQHPKRRHGKVWGQLVWDGKLWHDGEERPIWGASLKKWRLVGMADNALPLERPRVKPADLFRSDDSELKNNSQQEEEE